MSIVLITLFLCLQNVVVVFSQEGTSCQLSTGEVGICMNMYQCPYQTDWLEYGRYLEPCGFNPMDSLVCCKMQFTSELSTKPGDISLAKCEEYYPSRYPSMPRDGFTDFSQTAGYYSYPFQYNYQRASPSYPTRVTRDVQHVYIGRKTLANEFPHMAVIGYGSRRKTEWLCGGSLISPYYVLTAAHCLKSQHLGPARRVRLGQDFITTNMKSATQEITITRRIPHPDYKPPSKYNDIGLIQLDRPIERTPFVNIACLDAGDDDGSAKQMTVAGYGSTHFHGAFSPNLLKADLDLVPLPECQKHYRNLPLNLPNEILDDKQICARGKYGEDTCKGDSGGPLQVLNDRSNDSLYVYTIKGVTSFGKACGISKSPGVYTRVRSYLSWIEEIVWPSDTNYDPYETSPVWGW